MGVTADTTRGRRRTGPGPGSEGPRGDLDNAELQRQIQLAWASLLDRADAIADHITLTLLDHEKEWYDAAGPQMRAELRISSREHVRRGIATMAGLAQPGQEAVHVWRETGRRRARQGVPMEIVLSAYSLGTRVLWEALLDQQHDPDLGIDDHVLLIAGQRIWSSLDLQNATLIRAYRRESARLERRDLQRQVRVLDALVAGRGSDPAFGVEAHETLGIEVDEPVACVVAPFDGTLDNPLRNPEDRLEQDGLTSYWHVRGDALFGLVSLGRLTTSDLVGLLAPCAVGRVGVAGAPDGLAGFCTAYQLAMGTAETLPRGTPAVALAEDRLPELLVVASPAVGSLLVRETLGPVLAQPEHLADVLLSTLRALLDHNGSPTHAAEALFCHRNTVIYRMRQLAELTGRNLYDPRDRLLCSLALLALDS